MGCIGRARRELQPIFVSAEFASSFVANQPTHIAWRSS